MTKTLHDIQKELGLIPKYKTHAVEYYLALKLDDPHSVELFHELSTHHKLNVPVPFARFILDLNNELQLEQYSHWVEYRETHFTTIDQQNKFIDSQVTNEALVSTFVDYPYLYTTNLDRLLTLYQHKELHNRAARLLLLSVGCNEGCPFSLSRLERVARESDYGVEVMQAARKLNKIIDKLSLYFEDLPLEDILFHIGSVWLFKEQITSGVVRIPIETLRQVVEYVLFDMVSSGYYGSGKDAVALEVHRLWGNQLKSKKLNEYVTSFICNFF